jgi:guanine nucleotide-binding protein subunit alpha-12
MLLHQAFDSVTAILFLASASEFDQRLIEDNETNRVREAQHVFESLVNFPAFNGISFILFLNKMDLLEEKVKNRL